MDATSILEPVEEGTRFTPAVDYEVPRGILGKFLDKLFLRRQAEKIYVQRSLENLKSILEKWMLTRTVSIARARD